MAFAPCEREGVAGRAVHAAALPVDGRSVEAMLMAGRITADLDVRISMAELFSGAVDLAVLQGALDDVVARHELLRTLVVRDADPPYQMVCQGRAGTLLELLGGKASAQCRRCWCAARIARLRFGSFLWGARRARTSETVSAADCSGSHGLWRRPSE
ncbi:MAG TPA: hypothetical protein VIY52_01780 [Streptosporangiaceae bacterium]